MTHDFNRPGTATSELPDVRYYRHAPDTRSTELPASLIQADIDVWQRAVERVERPGETVTLDAVIQRLDADDAE